MSLRLRLGILVGAVAFLASCGKGRTPFTYSIDPAIAPSPAVLHDPVKGDRPLAASADANGNVSVFVANEVMLSTNDPTELNDFVARYGGTVLENDAVPDPPPSLGITLTADEKAPTSYLIRLDPTSFPLDHFESDAEAAGFGGAHGFSSDAAARLFALIMNERSAGLDASPNYFFPPQSPIINHTTEGPDPFGGATPIDAFAFQPLHMGPYLADGSKSNVLGAWQYVMAHGIARRVNVAIIDGGFWLDSNGSPIIVPPGTQSDLPANPIQYDFVGDDYIADGSNVAKCTGGASCPWHGNDNAGVALGAPDNSYGTAGTGGWVANPFLFKMDCTRAEIIRAIRTAQAWGADVASMSFGGSCNADCQIFMNPDFLYVEAAMKAKVVLVAAAGNDKKNVDKDPQWPCNINGLTSDESGVICVGALTDGNNTRIDYSNYGHRVDVFAPTNIEVMPNGGTGGALAIAGGTSAATPFVAGVAAMMKALDPGATDKTIRETIRNQAWTDSTDPNVPRYLNALAAVESIGGDTLPEDPFEPNDDASHAKNVNLGTVYSPLTLTDTFDYFHFSLAGYSSLAVNLDYYELLGDMNLTFADGTPQAVQQTLFAPNGSQITEDLLPPGDYTFLMWGPLNGYDIQVTATPVSLQPDAFEVNDTLATAALPATGNHLATRHTATDPDYYAYTASGLTPNFAFFFSIDQSDLPVSLSVYENGSFQGTYPAATTRTVELKDNASYVFLVDGTQPTRYSFSAGEGIDPNVFQFATPVDWIPVIDPTTAIDHVLVSPEDDFAFLPTAADLSRISGIVLSGAGVKLTLLDVMGNVVAEGVDASTSDGPAQQISFAGLSAGATYLLKVERTAAEPVANATLPLIRYTLAFQI